VVIPNSVAQTTLQADARNKRVLAAGRISPVKGFGDLIDAWAIIHRDFPEWELHIYGQDYLDTKTQLQSKIIKHNLEGVIDFKGTVTDLQKTMTNYSIYAMTSETECFPMVLLEALSVGLPIVTYNAPHGPKNIVKHNEDAFLVPHKNISNFAEQLKLLMGNQKLRSEMGQRAKANAHRFFLDEVMMKWRDLFKSLS
jgi:glycosyltransferase involved in cell wall biosynthesis